MSQLAFIIPNNMIDCRLAYVGEQPPNISANGTSKLEKADSNSLPHTDLTKTEIALIKENISALCQALELEPYYSLANTGYEDSFLVEAYRVAHEKKIEFVVFLPESSYFYNIQQSKKLQKNFLEYGADIGFGDYFPRGMIPFYVRTEALLVLENVRKQNNFRPSVDTIENIINHDVNAFDLENLYAPINLRFLRLDFFVQDQHSSLLAEKIQQKMLAKDPKSNPWEWDYEDFANLISSNRKSLMTLPKFFQFHTTSKDNQKRLLSPRHLLPKAELDTDLSLENFCLIVDKIAHHIKHPILSFSAAFSEPTLNPKWKEMLSYSLQRGFETLLETNGTVISQADLKEISTWHHQDKLKIIFQLEAIQPELYARFRSGQKGIHDILRIIENSFLIRPDTTYVEAIKVDDNLEHLLELHRHFKNFTNNIIINKYNPFRGKMTERRSRIINPLEKIDCWHLKRDLVIDYLGDVWMCKQDILKEKTLGNIIVDDWIDIIKKNQSNLEKHIAGMPYCQNCDEFYTFNY